MLNRFAAAALAAVLACAAGAALAQPDPNKVLKVAFLTAQTGFDPQATLDLYSNFVNRVPFDPLFRYDYVSRPYRIIPNTAAALPEISKGGLA